MITKELCVKIWHCYQQIEEGQKLLKEMGEIVAKDKEKKEPNFHDAFGERAGLELGVPSGMGGHRIFNVSVELGTKMVIENIAFNEQHLKELNNLAVLELFSDMTWQEIMGIIKIRPDREEELAQKFEHDENKIEDQHPRGSKAWINTK